MEHLLGMSKCSIFHNIFKCMIFQRRQQPLLWGKGLTESLPSEKLFPALLSSDDFFQINFFEKFFQDYPQCQIVWIQIRPHFLSGPIWVHTVCKGYQQRTLGGRVK